MWFVIIFFLALAILSIDVGIVLAGNKSITKRKVLNFTLLSSLVFTACVIVGCLLAKLLLAYADVHYMYWIVLAVTTAFLIVKSFKIKQFIILFYIDNRKDFIVSNLGLGLDMMLASLGCFFYAPKAYYLIPAYMIVSMCMGLIGVFVGLKFNSVKIIRYVFIISIILMLICLIFKFSEI